MRRGKFWLLGLALFALPELASAASLQKGTSMLAIQLSRGVADLAGETSPGLLLASSRSELGFQAQYWMFLADEYGVNVSAGIGYFKESEKADPTFGSNDFTETVNSWQVRIGGDRFAKVTDKLQIFAGPGIQLWSGKRTFENVGTVEDPSTTRWALGGRIGANIAIGENFGLIGHIGQYWGYASAKLDGAETKWLPSGSEGAMGFSFVF